jgi:hypothetical protein
MPTVIDANAPEFPDVLDYLWAWFQEISLGLSPSGFAPPVLTWEALRTWQVIMDVGTIEPWEARTLVQLGMLRASVLSEKSNSETQRQQALPSHPPTIGGAFSRRAVSPPPSAARRR